MNEQEIVSQITNKTKEILESLGFAADIKADLIEATEASEEKGEKGDNRNYINLNIEGEDLGLLIGYQGTGLTSLERVLDLMLTKLLRSEKIEERYKVLIDINNYKSKKTKMLQETALRAVEQVKDSGQEVELPAMNPAERRIVHLAIQEEKGVTSASEGEEGDRRVIIKPEKN